MSGSIKKNTKRFDDDVQALTLYTVGFVGSDEYQSNSTTEIDSGGALFPYGSGVLIQLKELKGVLTAGHVVEYLQKKAFQNIVNLRQGRTHGRVTPISTDDRNVIKIGGGSNGPDGPDIAFILLPPDVVEMLEVDSAFYSLDELYDSMQTKPMIDANSWDVCVVGFLGEGFRQLESGARGKYSGTVYSLHGREKNYRYSPNGIIYTICDFEINEVEDENEPNFPTTFGGLSGSGVWVIGSPVQKSNRALIGIVFYEKNAFENNRRDLIFNGWDSIYGHFTNQILGTIRNRDSIE